MTTRWRRPLGLAVAGSAVLLSASCVSIPTSSPVRQVQAVGVQQEPQLITNVPPGPTPGATREEVVSGFYAAMLAYPRSSATAKQFLTDDAAASWRAGAGLVVYDDQEIVDRGGVVSVRVHTLGSLDKRGKWTSGSTPAGSGRSVHLERAQGEWRITDPSAGTFIDSDYFTLYFRPFSLYFFDPTLSVLTPDPVYLMLGDGTATKLVSDLLLGPSPQLAGVVATAVPAGTELDGEVSPSSSGRIDVPVNETVSDLASEERQRLAAQLTWTLRQLPEVQSISVSVTGTRLDVPGVSVKGVFGVDEFAGYDPSFAAQLALFALSGKGMVTVSEEEATPVAGPVGATARKAQFGAVDPSATLAAVVRGGRVIVGGTAASADAPTPWFIGGESLLRPSWDVHRVLWLIDTTRAGAVVYAVTPDGIRPVRAPGIDGERVEAFAVSRDGVRLAAIIDGPRASRLVISVIDRDAADPTAVRLSPAHQVVSPGFTATRLSDLAWVSPTALLLLASEPGADPQPFEVSIDGSNASALGGFLPIRPVSVAAGPNVDAPVVIGSSSGEIYVQTPEQQWVRFGGSTRLRAPVYPG